MFTIHNCILQPHAAPSSSLHGFNSGPTELLVFLEPSKPHRPEWGHHKYIVTITEVENGRRVQQFDVNSTATGSARSDSVTTI